MDGADVQKHEDFLDAICHGVRIHEYMYVPCRHTYTKYRLEQRYVYLDLLLNGGPQAGGGRARTQMSKLPSAKVAAQVFDGTLGSGFGFRGYPSEAESCEQCHIMIAVLKA